MQLIPLWLSQSIVYRRECGKTGLYFRCEPVTSLICMRSSGQSLFPSIPKTKRKKQSSKKSRKKEENSTVKRPCKEKRDGNTCSVCVNRKYQRTVWCQVRKNQQPTRVISSLGRVIGAETSCCSARAIYSRLEAASCFACVISCAMPLPYKYGWLVVLPFSSTFFFPMLFTSFVNVLLFALCAAAFPVKRLYRPSSPVFSLIAHHEGAVFQYHLLKYNGKELLLNADEQAFFGRVRASEGYVLNLPGSVKSGNATQLIANTTNVHVDPKTYQLTIAPNAANATHGFGISKQKLTFRNSTEFLACPSNSYRGEYRVYWGNHNKTACPNKARGYNIELIVQTDAAINYNPSTNNNTLPGLSNTTLSNLLSPPTKRSKKWLFF